MKNVEPFTHERLKLRRRDRPASPLRSNPIDSSEQRCIFTRKFVFTFRKLQSTQFIESERSIGMNGQPKVRNLCEIVLRQCRIQLLPRLKKPFELPDLLSVERVRIGLLG